MRKLIVVIALALSGIGQAQAQTPAPTLINGDIRPATDLSGPWRWSVDPFRDGLAGFHGAEPGPSSRRYADVDPEEVSRKDPTALFEQDLANSPFVTLPGSWIGHDQSMRYYNGLVWYRRDFQAQPRPGKRYFLRFGAVEYRAHVFLNGKKIGEHEGGFTPFAFEVTNQLRSGRNQITVGADSERTWDAVPPRVTDWETYGGITRPVRLVETPATFIDVAWVRLTRNGRIRATVKLDGVGAGAAPVRVHIPQLNLALNGRTDAKGVWSGEVSAPAALQRWSPELPTLYSVSVQGREDSISDRIGFRTVEVRGSDILLNGKPVFLRGISLHEEELGSSPTRAMTPAAARALLTEIKQGLNGNFVRLAHYPHSEAMTRMADELGLLVWSEIPVYWRVNFARAETLELARRMQEENIVRDRNRASIVLWSVANETPVSPERNAFLNALVTDARSLDDTRLITAALLAERKGMQQFIDDPLAASLDVMAVNTYNGWYSDDPLSALPSIAWTSQVQKPLILSEFGAGAKAGFFDPANSRKFSEEFQAEYYRQTLAMASKVPALRGMSPWILKDFRSPRRQHPVFQQGWNRKGLISETGQRKQAFDVLARYYQQLKESGR